ncbi:MAG: hypothetical protein GY826_38625, partial [Fuerstiella sp.]|nr:hypothetical protein [Fuerstiella sp.]
MALYLSKNRADRLIDPVSAATAAPSTAQIFDDLILKLTTFTADWNNVDETAVDAAERRKKINIAANTTIQKFLATQSTLGITLPVMAKVWHAIMKHGSEPVRIAIVKWCAEESPFWGIRALRDLLRSRLTTFT